MGHDYKVEIVPPEKFRAGKVNKAGIQILNSGILGECEFPTRIIRLNQELDGKLMLYTLVHELRHGFQFELGWPQIMSQQMLEIDCESSVSFIFSMKQQGVFK